MILVKKFQAGGAVAPEDEAAMQQQQMAGAEQDPIMQIAQMFAQGLQAQDCELLARGAQAFLSLMDQAQSEGAPESVPEGQPVFAKGGKLVGYKPASFQLVRK